MKPEERVGRDFASHFGGPSKKEYRMFGVHDRDYFQNPISATVPAQGKGSA